MQRRHFVGQFAVAALGLRGLGALAPRSPLTTTLTTTRARRLKSVGLELWSVRDAMRKDPEGTMAKVRAIGYSDVECLWSLGNFGRTAKQVRATLDSTGLKSTSAHISPSLLTDGWDKALDMAHEIGHQTLIVPSFSEETSRTLDDWKRWGERFNVAGEKARAAKLWLAMHNEPEHQKLIDGKVPFEVFVEATDPRYVHLQLDVGNMTMGGGDPLAFLKRYAARIASFHIKDVVPDRTGDTELGKGNVNFATILAAVPDPDSKTFFVEQEGPKDSLASAKEDFEYLSRLNF